MRAPIRAALIASAGGLLYPDAYTSTDTTAREANSSLIQHTFTAIGIGTPDPRRQVVVALGHNTGAATHDSMTIGGISATRLVMANGAANANNSSIWVANVPTGTTANIVANFSIAVQLVNILVWVHGRSPTAVDTLADATAALSGGLDHSAGGLTIAYSTATSASQQTPTWVGVTTEADVPDRISTLNYSGGRYTGAAAELNRTITPAWDAGTERTLIAVSFGAQIR